MLISEKEKKLMGWINDNKYTESYNLEQFKKQNQDL